MKTDTESSLVGKITQAIPNDRITEIVTYGTPILRDVAGWVHALSAESAETTKQEIQTIADEHRTMASEIASSRQVALLQSAITEDPLDPLTRIAAAVEALAKEVRDLRIIVHDAVETHFSAGPKP